MSKALLTETWRDFLGQARTENLFTDFKPALDDHEANTEANRCINCYDAPCIKACPTEINIPKFISRIGSGNLSGAAKTILESNILGLSCAQACPTEVLCEGACVYNHLDGHPITIGKLQRHAVTYAYDQEIEYFKPGKASGKKVALIGSGPASLSCAHELRVLGHETVIFEKAHIPGGLNTSGIAPYKMKAEVSLREVERISKMGVKFEYGQELGKNLKVETLTSKYDAVFLGMGLGPDSKIDIPGIGLPLVQGAVEYIAKLKTLPAAKMTEVKNLKRVLIVGGGNTALDACREMKKLGIPEVVVSYRRGEKDMSGYAHEFKWARQEGVEFYFHTIPASFEKSTAVLQRTDSDGRIDLKVDLILMATGQSKLENLLIAIKGLEFDHGRLKTDAEGRTGNPLIFAAGDLANGGKEVVNAVAEGKRAARAIDKRFKNG